MRKGDYERFLILLYLCNSTAQVHVADLFPRNSRGLTSWGDVWTRLISFDREETLVDVGAYCLMPNHFHLLVREKEEGGISLFMQKLLTAYTMYFNTNNERTGSLFQGTYKATHVANDRYLKYLVSYIHLNPVKLIEPEWKERGIVDRKKAKKYLEEYRFSSFLDYCGKKRAEKLLIEMDVLKTYYDHTSPIDFKTSVTTWLENTSEAD